MGDAHLTSDEDMDDLDDDLYDEDDDDNSLSNGPPYSMSRYHSGVSGSRRHPSGGGTSSGLSSQVLVGGPSDYLDATQGQLGTSYGRNAKVEVTKRDHHNRLERRRRASIKDCFNDLRGVLPDVVGGKPSRAVILQKAARELAESERDNNQKIRSIRYYKSQIEELNAKSDSLQRTLESLRSRLQFGYDLEEENESLRLDREDSSPSSYD